MKTVTIKLFLTMFLITTALGLLVMFSGGLEWGTEDFGLGLLCTFSVATFVGVVTLVLKSDGLI